MKKQPLRNVFFLWDAPSSSTWGSFCLSGSAETLWLRTGLKLHNHRNGHFTDVFSHSDYGAGLKVAQINPLNYSSTWWCKNAISCKCVHWRIIIPIHKKRLNEPAMTVCVCVCVCACMCSCLYFYYFSNKNTFRIRDTLTWTDYVFCLVH